MTLLLPSHDGIFDHVHAQLPEASLLRYEDAAAGAPLDSVTFYCLPYMGGPDSLQLAARLPRLRVLQSLSSGVDDVLAAAPGQVTVCNGRGLHHEESTAELALALVLASLRELPRLLARQRERVWEHLRGDTLDGKRVLLVGYGQLGRAIEARLTAFGARVSRVSRTPADRVEPLSRLGELAAGADILVVCIALAEATRGLVDARVLAALPAGALVVNVARGPVVDADALRAELAAGRLRAALDVSDPEPLPPDRAEWALPGVIVTPHVGGDTLEFARRATGFVAEQARRHVSGAALRNVVRYPLPGGPPGG